MSSLDQIVSEWQQTRNKAAATDVSTVDAAYALKAGLPVLAALHTLEARLESGNKYASTRELLAELRPIINLAVGEAMRRAERVGCNVYVPGVPVVPMVTLLEQLVEGDQHEHRPCDT